MTPRGEGARLILNSSSSSDFRHFVLGNVIADLPQDVQLRSCWIDGFVFHPYLVAGLQRQSNIFLLSLGDGCASIYKRKRKSKTSYGRKSWSEKSRLDRPKPG